MSSDEDVVENALERVPLERVDVDASVLLRPPHVLAQELDLPVRAIAALCRRVSLSVVSPPVSVAALPFDRPLSTGHAVLDAALRGLTARTLTAFFGPSAGGKTALALHLASRAAADPLWGRTLWISAFSAFSAFSVFSAFPELGDMRVMAVSSLDALRDALPAIRRRVSDDGVRLVVVDGAGLLARRGASPSLAADVMRRVKEWAQSLSLAVLVTMRTTAELGHAFGHLANTRLRCQQIGTTSNVTRLEVEKSAAVAAQCLECVFDGLRLVRVRSIGAAERKRMRDDEYECMDATGHYIVPTVVYC